MLRSLVGSEMCIRDSVKTNLKALAEIPIIPPITKTELARSAAFQTQIPDYIKLCNRYRKTATKARRAVAERDGMQYIPCHETTESTEDDILGPNSALLKTIDARQRRHPHHERTSQADYDQQMHERTIRTNIQEQQSQQPTKQRSMAPELKQPVQQQSTQQE